MNKKQIQLLEFLEQSGSRLHRMLVRLTLDEEAAEELMQEVFLRLFKITHFERIENPEAYAARIAINLAFDRRRQHRWFSEIPQNRPDWRIPQVDRRLIQAEAVEKILDAAETLSGLTRECFVLRYVEQMEHEQIAKRTRKNTKQVRALCSKAIQRIRRILNEQNASFYKEAINE